MCFINEVYLALPYQYTELPDFRPHEYIKSKTTHKRKHLNTLLFSWFAAVTQPTNYQLPFSPACLCAAMLAFVHVYSTADLSRTLRGPVHPLSLLMLSNLYSLYLGFRSSKISAPSQDHKEDVNSLYCA